MMETFSVLKRNVESADRVREILGIPVSQEWSELRVSFGLDEVGTAVVTFLLEAEQTIALAQLAAQSIANDIVLQRSLESIQQDLVEEA